MITRIFRVVIDPELRDEFEARFAEVSVKAVETSAGNVSVSIGKPTADSPDEYVMISQWRDWAALIDFAGTSWNEAVIPPGMEKYLVQCWVHHYEAF